MKWPQLPNTSKTMWDANPLCFISYSVGHEGENSLLSELIKQDLATSLGSRGVPRLQESFDEFKIDITLTEKGMKEYEEVIRLVFAYLNKLKEVEPPKYMQDEIKIYDDLRFTFMAPTPARKMANSMAHRLNRWDPSNEHECQIENILY